MSRYELKDRVIAITGSTGGLGRALASALRAKGAKLALLDINHQVASTQARELGSSQVAQAWQADVRSLQSLEAAVAAASRHFGGIDVMIANAGIDVIAPLESMDPAAFDRVIDINLNGVWRTFRVALPYVRERKGYLLAISSMAAFVHSPLQAHYTASKAGVWAMCDSIRLELRHQGVGVGSVHPTFFQTPMMTNVHADPAGRKLWDGNTKGLWKMISLDEVVAATVRGIEQRADMVVIPKRNSLVARPRPVPEVNGEAGVQRRADRRSYSLVHLGHSKRTSLRRPGRGRCPSRPLYFTDDMLMSSTATNRPWALDRQVCARSTP